MAVTNPPAVLTELRTALADAMARRDRAAMAVYRTAISAIENAAAVPVGDDQRGSAIESSAVGVGRTEADRRSLSRADELAILAQEIRDRRATADFLAVTRPETARELRSEAELLQAFLGGG
jgi:uncharacterized protein YqeY